MKNHNFTKSSSRGSNYFEGKHRNWRSVLKSIANEDRGQKPQDVEKSVLQLSINPLHGTPCLLEDEAYLVSFKTRKGNTLQDFNLLPATKAELIQLALFLGTCTYFHTAATHEIVPGQHITSVPTSDGKVEITLSSDAGLVEILGDSDIASTFILTLNIDQLEAYEEFITSSIATNDAIHLFNIGALEASKQLQLAS
jgi:hypothetical protein